MSDELKLHILTRRDVAAGSLYTGWDESVCAARPTPEKHRALLSNPLLGGEDQAMQVIGTRGGRVIGRLDLVAGEVIADGAAAPILWGSAFYVPEAERKSMMGAMLLMKAQTAFHTMGANGPSQMALPLYEKLKWIGVPMQRWIGLRRSRSIVERYLGTGVLAAAARLGADAGLAVLRGVNEARRVVATGGLRVRRVEAMPREFDEVLRRPMQGVRGHRSAAWIDWLLVSRFEPQQRHERALFLVESSGGGALGYFLLKVKFHAIATHRAFPNLTLATLADWMIFEPSRLTDRGVAMLASRAAWDLSADALEVCVRPGSDAAGFRTMGFIPAGVMTCMWKSTKPGLLAEERFRDPSVWSVRYADGENVPG